MEYFFPVECKQCQQRWKMKVVLSEQKMQSIGAICQCGAIFAGIIKAETIKEFLEDTNKFLQKEIREDLIRKVHLTNGNFVVLDMDVGDAMYPLLESEI
ncbi:MAG: hypothetical protein D6732_26800 [Methanobacteriota archaeon]|nr:MAG: hypothetical protein D6732_26800 [Euryarchaeota archaeon]